MSTDWIFLKQSIFDEISVPFYTKICLLKVWEDSHGTSLGPAKEENCKAQYVLSSLNSYAFLTILNIFALPSASSPLPFAFLFAAIFSLPINSLLFSPAVSHLSACLQVTNVQRITSLFQVYKFMILYMFMKLHFFQPSQTSNSNSFTYKLPNLEKQHLRIVEQLKLDRTVGGHLVQPVQSRISSERSDCLSFEIIWSWKTSKDEEFKTSLGRLF